MAVTVALISLILVELLRVESRARFGDGERCVNMGVTRTGTSKYLAGLVVIQHLEAPNGFSRNILPYL
jgi:hypothetical protein